MEEVLEQTYFYILTTETCLPACLLQAGRHGEHRALNPLPIGFLCVLCVSVAK